MLGQTQFADEVAAGKIKMEGDATKLSELFAMLDTFTPDFPIVTP